jgi:hypothetical protein
MSNTNTPDILWNTLTENSLFTGVVASVDPVGFEAVNVYDWKMSTFWEATAPDENIDFEFSSSVTCDTLFFRATNLAAEGHDYSFQYWNGASWVDLIAQTTPTSDIVVFKSFASQAATKFRFNVFQGGGTGNATYISNILLGQKMDFERGVQSGFAYPDNADNPEILNSITQGGNFIGRTVQSKSAQTSMSIQNMTDAYVTATYNPFIRHIQLKPFAMLPNPDDRPTDAAYCWTEGKVGDRKQSGVGLVSHSMKINMRVD